ncbi:putative DELLA protein SLR1-like [Capsicum annuum]|uniref:uncharacterized protein LOC107870444 n=1 Tax=Capsicum annuum TaxID=4072 RepID=UPI001FB09FEC|nr:uncharacterized protein LOC107870444 [Capsicum annuum]KAF3657592.1 putative DELLA protein SLR1-like [Capsicum annuum]KAF3662482.1 putative DELLA protein SLR1-like [Capsicum annuum]
MESHRDLATKAISFCLLPSELIQYIILQLALPEIIQLKLVNKSIFSIISDQNFVRNYNNQSSSATWLFLYKKRWRCEAILYGFTDCSNRWFNILIADLLKQVVPPGEDVYFLTANANIFLFALNNRQEVMSVDIMTRMVKKIPPSPLGPRGTSSWRRSGMKLLSCPYNSEHFRFLFAELHESHPTLFEYNSRVERWQFTQAIEVTQELGDDFIFLSASNGRNGSVIIGVRPDQSNSIPVVIRPTFITRGNEEDRLAIGFSWGNAIDILHVYGDGNIMTIKSDKVNKTVRKIKRIELWGLSTNGRYWEFISMAPNELIVDKISKPYGAMIGCMQKTQGITRAILMTNLEGTWETIWLSYNKRDDYWAWLSLPDCNMKGSNLAGVTFSSGLTLT